LVQDYINKVYFSPLFYVRILFYLLLCTTYFFQRNFDKENTLAVAVEIKVKGTVSRDFLLLVFFMNQFPPSPRAFHLDRFEFFRKFTEIFASQGAPPVAKLPPVSTTPVANLPPVSATPVANFSTIFASVIDTGGKFAAGVNDTGGKGKGKNLYMLTLLPKGVQTKLLKFFCLKVFSIELRISPRIFEKIRNGPNVIIRGLGETDSRKKPEAKNLLTLSL
jgi:hypothetical protein